MRFRLDSKAGLDVPSPDQALEQIHVISRPAAGLGRPTRRRSRNLRAARTPDSPRLRATCRPPRRQSARAGRPPASPLARSSLKKVAASHAPLAYAETRSLAVRLLGGLVLYVATLYCGPAARTGRGRGKEGTGLYPELAVLGFSEGASAGAARPGRSPVRLAPFLRVRPPRIGRAGHAAGHQGGPPPGADAGGRRY